MKPSKATVENTFQRGIEINFYDGKDVPNSESNFINNTDNLGFDGLDLDNDCRGLGNDSLGFNNDSLSFDNDSLSFDNDSLGLGNDSLDLDRDGLDLDRDSLDLDRDSLSFDRDSLSLDNDSLGFDNDCNSINRFWVSFRSVALLIYSYLITCKFDNVKLILKIKYSIYNNKGVHFNLDFINYSILRILFLIFKILFNKKFTHKLETNLVYEIIILIF